MPHRPAVTLAQRTRGPVVVIDVHGPMIRDEAEPVLLLDALRAAIELGQTRLLLNVAEVAMVDSLWLGALMQGYTTAMRRGGTLKLLNVSRRFRELLAVTKLDRVLEIYDSEEAALSSLGV